VGVDKGAIYSQDSATLLAQAMQQTTGQRIGLYGEFFMNFGWIGAIVGALLYGGLIAYLDRQYENARPNEVRAVLLALTIAAGVFAQIGQLNMFTSTLTGFGYPILIVGLIAARRSTQVE